MLLRFYQACIHIIVVCILLDNGVICQQTLNPKKTAMDGDAEVFYQGICLNSEATKMKIKCRENEKLKILRTVYGYNPLSNVAVASQYCTFSIKDCYYDRDNTIDDECTGKNSCDITIQKSLIQKEAASYKQQLCQNYNYVQINFQCLPNLRTIDICEVAQLQLNRAYIVTPNYPANIVGGAKCECTIKANDRDGQILLRRIDMKIPGNRENELCNDAFLDIIENNKRSEKKCGYMRETGSIFGSGANELKFTFSTTRKENWSDRGFWLEIQASPPNSKNIMDIKCNKDIENLYINKKLKAIEEKLRNSLTKYTLKALRVTRPSKLKINPNKSKLLSSVTRNSTLLKSLINQKQKQDVVNNSENDNSIGIEDYDMLKDILDRELNEIILNHTATSVTTYKQMTTDKPTTTVIIRSQIGKNSKNNLTISKQVTRPLDKLKNRNEGLNEWKKALGETVSDQQLSHDTDDSIKAVQSNDVKNNQHSQANIDMDAAAQKQDLSQIETRKSNSAVFTGIGISIILVSVIMNAAMCYSCYTKKNLFDKYSDVFNSRSSLEPSTSSPYTFEKGNNVFTRFSSFITQKIRGLKGEPQETYDNFYTGSMPASGASTLTRVNCNQKQKTEYNADIAYNSGLESVYSASIVSESDLSTVDNYSYYPNLPPPDERDEDNAGYYSEYYDKFGDGIVNEPEIVVKNSNSRPLQINKYAVRR